MKIVNNNNMKNLAMQRQSLTRIMYCPNCKQEFPGKFCPECGTKLIEKSMRMCPNCKVEVESKFCPECGAQTVEVVEKMVKMCPNCKVETESKFCPECGAKIEEMAVKATATSEIVAAGQQEDAETCYRTAEDYYYGRNGKTQDYEEAVNWYNKAAEQGHAAALYSLGYCYENGEGVDLDEGEAFEWYLKAAERGHLKSQAEVGRLFYMTDQYEEAVPWLLKAAERDDVDAQRLLGYCYEVGLGVDEDKNEAIKWYKRAAAQGDEQAIEELEKFDEQDVD